MVKIANTQFTEATTTKSIVFPETSTTPIKRINPEECRFLESAFRLDLNQKKKIRGKIKDNNKRFIDNIKHQK